MLVRILFLLLLAGCSPSSLEDLRYEGEAQTKKLAAELRSIENKEQLQKAVPRLKKRFVKMAEVLVEARQFPKEEAEPSMASEELFAELARLYEMPGGRELIELAQSEAIQKLE